VKLLHYPRALEGFEFEPFRSYDLGPSMNGKPRGFWVSVQGPDDWYEWCTSEEWATSTLPYPHEVTLAAGANLLVLSTVAELRAFTAQYLPAPGGFTTRIDWASVQGRYDGIVIAPYQWELRFDVDMHWYYTWDCASGCIWNLNAIDAVTPVFEAVTV